MVKVLNVKTGEIAEQQFTVDSEFKALIPPLSAEERQLLEASIIAEGCRDAIVVWQGHSVILDGHNRYDICTAHNVPLFVAYHDFETRDHVIVWIVQNQLARRNITQYAKDELVIQNLKPALERIGTQRMSEGGKGLSDSDKPSTKHNTQKELADMANTSTGGIAQSDFIAKHAPDRVKGKARSGDMSRDRAYRLTKALEQSPTEWQGRIVELCDDNDEKVRILNRLHKSAGQPDTNGTFEEVMRAGGFHYGKDMELWCDFAKASVEDIQRALKSVAEHHARELSIVRTTDRRTEARDLAEVQSRFTVIYADPPWEYEHTKTDNRRIENHYPTMPLDAICALPVDSVAAADCVLFVWATSPKLAEAMRVIDAWGFTYRTSMVWVKDKIGMGYYARQRHELLLIATRGTLPVPDPAVRPDSVVEAPRLEHSAKPHIFYSLIEAMYPDMPRLELFARNTRPGWTAWGNEVEIAA
jgi:N6-adenosine-specific RNA methylase IME4